MDDEIVLQLPDDIHKLCRTCMSVTENVLCHNILLHDSNEITLAGEMLQFCLPNSIGNEDGLPKSICDECARSLEIVYNFKNQCEQTEISLRKILNLPGANKQKLNSTKKNSEENLNCMGKFRGGVLIYNNYSVQNYIDNTVETFEETEITGEALLHKIKVSSNIHVDVQDSDTSIANNSKSQDDIITLIEERKEAEKCTEENELPSLTGNKNKVNSIKQEIFSEDETNIEVRCKLCDESFSNEAEFSSHTQFCKNKNELENILKLETDSIEQIELCQDENNDLFPHACTICGSKFKTRQGKNAHMSAHQKSVDDISYKETPYTCDLCSKIFMTESKLSAHFYKHASQIRLELGNVNNTANNEKKNVCVTCHESFTSKEDLKEHSKKHTKTEKVVCEICNIDFVGEANLVRHLRKHGIQILLCKICLKRFENLMKLKEHMKTHLIESIKTVFKCPICKIQFMDIESLKLHSVEHLNEVYECAKCRKTFHNKVAYDNHEKQHIEPRFLCSLCGKQYFSSVTLACHIRAHNNEKPFVCPHCKKGFSSRATLSVHKRIHSTFKPYVCSYCGYSCRQSGDLAMHIRTHTGDKPYKCTFPNCERKFTTSSQRKEHYRRHTNERNHKCPLCGKAFLESKTLKVHMLVHTGEKPHSCDICGKKFRRTHHLSNHMKGHKDHILGV